MDTQDFSEQGLRALGVAIRRVRIFGLIFENPTITRADVKITFVPYARAEADPVKVMIVLRLIGSDYRYFASWIGDVGVWLTVNRATWDTPLRKTPPESVV